MTASSGPGLASAADVLPSGPLHGSVAAPGSKSHTNRALIAAALADGISSLSDPLVAEDTEAMAGGLRSLGISVRAAGATWTVGGAGGDLAEGSIQVDCRLSGTTLRFLVAVATLTRGSVTLAGRPALNARPIAPLVTALRRLGCDLEAVGDHPPVVVRRGRPQGGHLDVDASLSSQFVTALLLVAPYAARDLDLHITGLGARGYVEMTAALMSRWGAEVRLDGTRAAVRAGRAYRARNERIAGDASAAAHLMALAVASGGEVEVTNLALASEQPDLAMVGLLERMGARCQWSADGESVLVAGPERLRPLEADLAALPDQLPTLAALAALAPGTTRLTGIGVTRFHETDRVAALAAELARAGIATETDDDALTIHGGRPRGPATIETYGDHRMAMAFAALAARVPGLTIQNPGCVAKTFPGFWESAHRLGLTTSIVSS